MSIEGDIFNICVAGSRKSIIRMMNAVIRNAGSGKVIAEGDNIETINLKLGEFIGKGGKDIGKGDLLDESCMHDEVVQEKKNKFENRKKSCKNCPFDCPNAKRDADFTALKELEGIDEEEYYSKMEEYCPWDEPYDADNNDPDDLEPDRYLEVVRVEDGPKDCYTVKFSWYLYECYGPNEYLDWLDIARLYNCIIFIDDNYYRSGSFIRFESATIIEEVNGLWKETRLESGSTDEEYDTFIETLAERYPERYRPIRDQYLQEKQKK